MEVVESIHLYTITSAPLAMQPSVHSKKKDETGKKRQKKENMKNYHNTISDDTEKKKKKNMNEKVTPKKV